ncbi:NAD(P)-dependent alcohol dehydrogenase [Streptomyces sp. NPDC058794]|uniref:NAD(P)-dependent alcohol dehydrogenase n=1 Tax=unclassified Streptomyces TaxID=2593676 RepID=UPI0036BD311D
MRAAQLRTPRRGPELVEVPVPEPGWGQVLLAMTAVGLCHSDFLLLDTPLGMLRRMGIPVPLTLGHEPVGTVAALGAGVHGLREGDAVAVYGPRGCGACRRCAGGAENLCPRSASLGIAPPGLGAPGGLAEYMLVDSARHLVPLGGLDPVQAAPLTDAGLSAYHAVRRSLPKLVAGSTAVVIGIGGLGHLAVQLLRVLTAARVVALDVSEAKRQLAAELGAHTTLMSDEAAAPRIRELTDGAGADVVLDFVGTPQTVGLAGACVGIGGDVTIAGVGRGALPVGFDTPAYGVSVAGTYWGTRTDLVEVLELARSGLLTSRVRTFALDEVPEAYEMLRQGLVTGRAVVLPAR